MEIIEFLWHQLVFCHEHVYFSCPKLLHKFIIIIIIIVINVVITESTITAFLHHHHHHYSTNIRFVTHFFHVECVKPLENIKNKNWYIETILLLQKVVTH